MTPEVISNNISCSSTREKIMELAAESAMIKIAVAFFSDAPLINELMDSGQKLTLIVSLRPPTNYYALKKILYKKNINILYLGDNFHSKVYAFFKDGNLLTGSLIGSSNLSSGGLENNIETNVLLKDNNSLKQVEHFFRAVETMAVILQPDILEDYKIRYDDFIKRNPPGKRSKKGKPKNKKRKNIRLSSTASEYYDFWKVADNVKELVQHISDIEYPRVPTYLVIDHFWHWIVQVCKPNKLIKLRTNEQLRDQRIPVLFKEYCKWEKSFSGYTAKLPANSRKIQKLLSRRSLKNLDKKKALEVYSLFHATQSLMQRFDSDKLFVKENKLSAIQNAFSYLLHSNDPIDLRIHELISQNGKYKLRQFGTSCVQELIGWFNPNKMPIRNEKANKAIELLGYR